MKRSHQEMSSAKGVYPMKHKEKAQLVNRNMRNEEPTKFLCGAWQIWVLSSTGKGQHTFPPSIHEDSFPLNGKLAERCYLSHFDNR